MNPSDARARPFPWILPVFLLALAFRLIYLFDAAGAPMADELGLIIDAKYYDLWARSIAAGDWIGRDAFFMAPLYPYVVAVLYAVLGDDFLWVRIAQLLLGFLTTVGVYFLGCRVFSKGVGLAGAVACTFYGMFFYYENLLLATSLLVALSVGCALLLVEADRRGRPVWWLASGLALGISAVGKANMLLAWPILAAWIWFRDRKASLRNRTVPVAWFTAGIALMIAPVTIRNALVEEDFVLLTANGGLNFFVGNNAEASGAWQRKELPWPGSTIDHHQAALAAGTKAYADKKPSEISGLLMQRALDFIKTDTGGFIKLLAKKAVLALNACEVGNRDSFYFAKRFSWFLPLLFLSFGIVAPLGLLGMACSLREMRRFFIPLVFVIVPWATMVLVFVLARYRLPMVPFLILFAAHALAELRRAVSPLNAKKLGVMVMVLAGGAVLVHWPVGALKVKFWRAAAETAYGGYLADEGKYERALEELNGALALDPEDQLALNLRASVLLKLEDPDGAAGDYRRAMELYPEDPWAPLQLAEIEKRRGRVEEAKSFYGKAVSRGKEKRAALGRVPAALVRAHLGLGRLHAEEGERAAAEKEFKEGLLAGPNNPELLHALASLLVEEEGRHGEALNYAAKAVSLRPSAALFSTLGWACYKSGRIEEALKYLEKAGRLKPKNEEIKARLEAVRRAGDE